jgi:hypothetical protein
MGKRKAASLLTRGYSDSRRADARRDAVSLPLAFLSFDQALFDFHAEVLAALFDVGQDLVAGLAKKLTML